jgi:flagellar biosynthesis regulator FlbT
MYEFQYEPELTELTIRDNYLMFYDLLKLNKKIDFVKRLKEYTNLGLKDAKINSDLIFESGLVKFDNYFNVRALRKTKLEKLKVRLFSKELYDMIKSKDDDEIVNNLAKLDIWVLENILENFLND